MRNRFPFLQRHELTLVTFLPERKKDHPLAFACVGRRPAKEGTQSLAWIEFEDPACRLRTDIKTAEPWQRHAFTRFKALVHGFDNAVNPGRCYRFISVHTG